MAVRAIQKDDEEEQGRVRVLFFPESVWREIEELAADLKIEPAAVLTLALKRLKERKDT